MVNGDEDEKAVTYFFTRLLQGSEKITDCNKFSVFSQKVSSCITI